MRNDLHYQQNITCSKPLNFNDGIQPDVTNVDMFSHILMFTVAERMQS